VVVSFHCYSIGNYCRINNDVFDNKARGTGISFAAQDRCVRKDFDEWGTSHIAVLSAAPTVSFLAGVTNQRNNYDMPLGWWSPALPNDPVPCTSIDGKCGV
jgi:hypothetical protein